MPENPRKPKMANILVTREAKFFFWPRLPRKSGLGINMAEKAGLLWPRLPRKLGRRQVCQAWPGRIFLVSLAKNLESLPSLAWPGLARLAGFLTGLLMQGHFLLKPPLLSSLVVGALKTITKCAQSMPFDRVFEVSRKIKRASQVPEG